MIMAVRSESGPLIRLLYMEGGLAEVHPRPVTVSRRARFVETGHEARSTHLEHCLGSLESGVYLRDHSTHYVGCRSTNGTPGPSVTRVGIRLPAVQPDTSRVLTRIRRPPTPLSPSPSPSPTPPNPLSLKTRGIGRGPSHRLGVRTPSGTVAPSLSDYGISLGARDEAALP